MLLLSASLSCPLSYGLIERCVCQLNGSLSFLFFLFGGSGQKTVCNLNWNLQWEEFGMELRTEGSVHQRKPFLDCQTNEDNLSIFGIKIKSQNICFSDTLRMDTAACWNLWVNQENHKRRLWRKHHMKKTSNVPQGVTYYIRFKRNHQRIQLT